MVTNDKIMMSSVLQILKSLVFKFSILIIPQIRLIFSLQENTGESHVIPLFSNPLLYLLRYLGWWESMIKVQFIDANTNQSMSTKLLDLSHQDTSIRDPINDSSHWTKLLPNIFVNYLIASKIVNHSLS